METYTVTVYENGYRQWWQKGLLHRTDGPAVEFADGERQWWIEGRFFTEKRFNQQTKKSTCENKTVIIYGIKYKLHRVNDDAKS